MNKLLLLSTPKNNNCAGTFSIEPLMLGQSITIGNALKRTLLTEIENYAVTHLQVNDVRTEFESLPYVREEILEIALNLKDLVFLKPLISPIVKTLKCYVFENGPKIITSKLIKIPQKVTKIINGNHYICTLTMNFNLSLELILKLGKGRILSSSDFEKIYTPMGINKFALNANFSPIKKVNYSTHLIYDNNGFLRERLLINVLTNGAITPIRCMHLSIKTLLKFFYPLLNIYK